MIAAAPLTWTLCAARDLQKEPLFKPRSSICTRHCFAALADLFNEVQHDKDFACQAATYLHQSGQPLVAVTGTYVAGAPSEYALPSSRFWAMIPAGATCDALLASELARVKQR